MAQKLFGKPKSSVVKHPGAFSAKAKVAGMSTAAYAAKESKPGAKVSPATKKQAVLAKTLMKMGKKRGK